MFKLTFTLFYSLGADSGERLLNYQLVMINHVLLNIVFVRTQYKFLATNHIFEYDDHWL